MKRLAMVVAPLMLLACGSKKNSTVGSIGGSSASSGTSASTSAGSTGAASSSATTTTGASSSTTTSGGASTGTTGSTACSAPCANSNDCGGSRSCFNDCCVNTADTCSDGSCAYGPCATGWQCDTGTDCCVPDGGSTSGGTTGGTTGGFACAFDGGVITSGFCSPDCDPGFHCENGSCVLNGGQGPIQVTLRYCNFDDLDLHVLQPDGCEVWYGNTACPNGGGSLDLDSNAGCGASTVDAENIIYTPLDAGGIAPPSGTYTVRVDMYENCDGASHIPYEIIVRHNGITDQPIRLGFDNPSGGAYQGDNGQAGSGVFVTTFTYP